MTLVRWAVLADGSSDRALIPVLRWAMMEIGDDLKLFEPDFEVRNTSHALVDEMQRVADQFRPDILFVHRDAERRTLDERRAEIPNLDRPLVRVVPVRMTEAWLLIDEAAIRAAASNPNGRIALNLPSPSRLERVTDPKEELRHLILTASELPARRLQKLRQSLGHRVQLVAERIVDFGPLAPVPAFSALEADLRHALAGILPA